MEKNKNMKNNNNIIIIIITKSIKKKNQSKKSINQFKRYSGSCRISFSGDLDSDPMFSLYSQISYSSNVFARHHSTTFSYNRLSGSENTWTKPGNTYCRMDGHTDEVVPIINNTLPDFVTGERRGEGRG